MKAKRTIIKFLFVYLAIYHSALIQATEANVQQGQFSVLTYNIAALPDWISQSKPSVNVPIMSPLINRYDIVLVQEDFEYHLALDLKAEHAHRSKMMNRPLLLSTDGLNRYSRFPFANLKRVRWHECHGVIRFANDCLAKKGFSMARHEIAKGHFVDIYNLHADAGRREGDTTARRSEFSQLALYISIHSKGNALIIAGDTNLKFSEEADEKILIGFLKTTNTIVVARALNQLPDMIDRVIYRSSADLKLLPRHRYIASEFIDANKDPLSDHLALAVEFSWSKKNKVSALLSSKTPSESSLILRERTEK